MSRAAGRAGSRPPSIARSSRSVSPGHGRPSSSWRAISGRANAANATRCGASVRRIEPDPARGSPRSEQDVVARPAAERPLVEPVDLALDAFDDLEVAGEHLVGDGRHEPCRIHRAEARLALGHRVEPFECLERPVVDGDDPVLAGDEVERSADGHLAIALGIRRRLHRLAVTRWRWSTYCVRSARFDSFARRATSAGSMLDRGDRGFEVAGRPPVNVDPEQLSLADPLGQPGSSSISRSCRRRHTGGR